MAGASLISIGLAAYEIVPVSVTPLIQDSLRVGPTAAGLPVGVMFGSAVVVSLPAGAVLDRVFDGRRRPVVLWSFGLAAPLLLGFMQLRSLALLVAILLLIGFAVQLTLGLSFTYVREVVDLRVAATAVAFQTSIGLAGAFVAPIAGGIVMNRAGFDPAFLLAGAVAVAGIIVTWQAPEPGRK
ncbi:MFS transporter [Haloarcula brevis]|uniref:MFS transporter n=1 Tax=Haloarcula brevis TaxID=3111453 RepID=UPI00300F33B0